MEKKKVISPYRNTGHTAQKSHLGLHPLLCAICLEILGCSPYIEISLSVMYLLCKKMGAIMHQSFVTTAPPTPQAPTHPPMGNSGDNDIHPPQPC